MRKERSRGAVLYEVVIGASLAVVVVGALGAQIVSQARLLRAAQDESRARAALLSAYERVRAGLVAPPAAGETRSLEAPPGFAVTLARAPGAIDARLERPSLVPVVLEVRWRSEDGGANARSLATLVAGAGR